MSIPRKRQEGAGRIHIIAAPASPCIAVVGSREFADLGRVRRLVASLPSDVFVLSGGAPRVDRCAIAAARARGLRCLEYLANWDRDGRYWAGRIRNQRVAQRCDRRPCPGRTPKKPAKREAIGAIR
jgi:YspA, cpYpsA-related SLOG family